MNNHYQYLQTNYFNSINKFRVIILLFAIIFIGCNEELDMPEDFSISDMDTVLCLAKIDGNYIEVKLDEAPYYLDGGYEGYIQAIMEELNYPAEARENGIEGICVINYNITEEGKVESIEVIEDPGGGIGMSSITSIQLATEGISFSPAILNGSPIEVKKELEIKFKLL